MSDAFISVAALAAAIAIVLFFLGLIAEVLWPWLADQWQVRTVRPPARYLARNP
ncbi:MAG: hypothetical protein KAX46_03070 [Chromatiaceae bacterium]|nr:hypothetical protein [Chromatiaceae bacterium]